MTFSNRSWRLRGAFIAAAAGVVGVGLSAVPAQAHTPTWSVSCSDVTLDLTAYNPGVTNTVTVSVDGKDILPTEKFGSSVNRTLPLGEHTKTLTVHLVVKAGDGDQFSRDETKTAPVCAATPPATPPPASQPPTAAPSSAAPVPSKAPSSAPSSPAAAAPAPSPSAGAPSDLAETGSSSATPLIAGAAAVVILAGGGIMFAARKRRSSEN
ncbi:MULTISPECIES: LAETG motif-containing sortase-dependent surface protein [unclassified Streptomyces]|uniref:LAETG motif-containing sortase-dependent surface protein n=1 Tax=unclassified Streptomyces TaxID=2593676 RepID=UPI002E14DC60|nr:LPXTG cell wall anchor domain-containing protein [Streptomyces sp. NBC_01197]WSS47568.1 LPXTG cell wall anchor domain-containing protein [Streptomyces sp. NBC_01180]